MAEFAGEKTEQATGKKLAEAQLHGNIPRSAEVQTVFVLGGGVIALMFTAPEMWRVLSDTLRSMLGHLHETPLTLNTLPGYTANAALLLGACVWPVLAATVAGALLAGGIQNRFQTASEALDANWDRLNPIAGLQRVFSVRALMPTAVNATKFAVVVLLTWSEVKRVLGDPIFYTSVDVARIAGFMAESAARIVLRVGFVMLVIAAADYAYQVWRYNRDMMMTKEEVKDEAKASEGSPEAKNKMRKRRREITKRKMLAAVPKADVIVTNPTHLAIALRYDRKRNRAPIVVAKGSRLNALQIREIAQQHQVPIIENKPLARVLFKYGRVGGEIPAELYAAVAEVLALVYRINAYRYYREQAMAAE
ncbi:MAG: EscU/YscU/HrcU family type III secretion system export apparatus switch protein [Verrucomicrobia bacterium]|nr:EscU/YscU/HrcU family type III secretion system export apparatus switch protein [Verrucomicrobiota bacterium]